jgi:hypothetical protein
MSFYYHLAQQRQVSSRTIVVYAPRVASRHCHQSTAITECQKRIRKQGHHHWNEHRYRPLLPFPVRFGSHKHASWHRHKASSTSTVWSACAILPPAKYPPTYGQWFLDGGPRVEFPLWNSVPNAATTARPLTTTTATSSDQEHHGGAQSERSSTISRIHLKACWNDDDLQEGDVVQTPFNLHDIQQEAQDLFGSNEQLEYYNGDDWCRLDEQSLREIPAVLIELKETLASSGYGSGKLPPLPIRVPSLYDEEYGMENDLVKMRKMTPEQMQAQRQGMPTEDQAHMYDVLQTLHTRLLQEGYTRHCQPKRAIDDLVLDPSKHDDGDDDDDDHDDYEYTVMVDNVALPTRTWILEQAEDDATVRSVLLSQPRALRHITEALHYPLF